MSKKPEIIKDSTLLTNPYFNTPKTNLLYFQFKPDPFDSVVPRIKNAKVHKEEIEGKWIYVIDNFFSEEEALLIREFTKQAGFSRKIFGSAESIEKGEKCALSMSSKERWALFTAPPSPLLELYKFFSNLSHRLNVNVATLPWELCDSTTSSPAIATNFLQEMTQESQELGKHKDYDPEKGLPFAIPKLFAEGMQYHEGPFSNGSLGKPWLVSVMLYATSESFHPDYGMGTVFYDAKGNLVSKTACHDMRIVLFEGDIVHSIEESKHTPKDDIWRISYVFKLVINPSRETQNLKELFAHEMDQPSCEG